MESGTPVKSFMQKSYFLNASALRHCLYLREIYRNAPVKSTQWGPSESPIRIIFCIYQVCLPFSSYGFKLVYHPDVDLIFIPCVRYYFFYVSLIYDHKVVVMH
jgi:hypothetical protein